MKSGSDSSESSEDKPSPKKIKASKRFTAAQRARLKMHYERGMVRTDKSRAPAIARAAQDTGLTIKQVKILCCQVMLMLNIMADYC